MDCNGAVWCAALVLCYDMIKWYGTVWYVVWHCVVSHRIVSCCIVLYHVMSHHIPSQHIMSFHAMMNTNRSLKRFAMPVLAKFQPVHVECNAI